MNEKEYLEKIGDLITEMQYKIIIIKMCIILTVSSLICLGGMAVMMIFESNRTSFWIGLALFLFGTFLLIFDAFFLRDEYSEKIHLYRHYKKHPEYFDSNVNPS